MFNASASKIPVHTDAVRLVEQLPAVLWTTDLQLKFTSSQGAGLKGLELKPNEVVGVDLWEYFGTSDRQFPPIAASLAALEGQSARYEQVWRGVTFQVYIEPLRSSKGEICGTLGIALDISDRKKMEAELREAHDQLEKRVEERTAELSRSNTALQQSEEKARRLLSEVEHRVRNNLAGLVALVQVMRTTTLTVDEFATTMEARLMAMVHVHRLLAEQAGGDIELHDIVQSLLDAMASLAVHATKVSVTGQPARIPAGQTQPLIMVLLEWFTNSIKYGAHAKPGGRLDVTWNLEPQTNGQQMVHFRWKETPASPIVKPTRTSLGTELVKAFSRRELRGNVTLNFPESGADHLLAFPVQAESLN